MIRTKARGFTLIELLVTVSLLSVLGASILGLLGGGLSVWKRVQRQDKYTYHVRLVLERMRQDLRSAQHFKPIPFEGAYDKFSFPAVLHVEWKEAGLVQEIGQRGFFLSEGKKLLCRSERPYRKMRYGSMRDSGRPLADRIERIRFSYYGPDPTSDGYHWTGSWSSEWPPLAVKIDLGYRVDNKSKLEEQTLIVNLPTATKPAR